MKGFIVHFTNTPFCRLDKICNFPSHSQMNYVTQATSCLVSPEILFGAYVKTAVVASQCILNTKIVNHCRVVHYFMYKTPHKKRLPVVIAAELCDMSNDSNM